MLDASFNSTCIAHDPFFERTRCTNAFGVCSAITSSISRTISNASSTFEIRSMCVKESQRSKSSWCFSISRSLPLSSGNVSWKIFVIIVMTSCSFIHVLRMRRMNEQYSIVRPATREGGESAEHVKRKNPSARLIAGKKYLTSGFLLGGNHSVSCTHEQTLRAKSFRHRDVEMALRHREGRCWPPSSRPAHTRVPRESRSRVHLLPQRTICRHANLACSYEPTQPLPCPPCHLECSDQDEIATGESMTARHPKQIRIEARTRAPQSLEHRRTDPQCLHAVLPWHSHQQRKTPAQVIAYRSSPRP